MISCHANSGVVKYTRFIGPTKKKKQVKPKTLPGGQRIKQKLKNQMIDMPCLVVNFWKGPMTHTSLPPSVSVSVSPSVSPLSLSLYTHTLSLSLPLSLSLSLSCTRPPPLSCPRSPSFSLPLLSLSLTPPPPSLSLHMISSYCNERWCS